MKTVGTYPKYPSSEVHAVDVFLATVLRETAELTSSPQSELVSKRACYHGVTALLVSSPANMILLPPHVQASLRKQAIAEAMWDLRHRRIIGSLLQDLHSAKVEVALLKGTALAYSVYKSPADRPRGDTDILVREAQLPQASAILARHGFRRASEHKADRSQQDWSLEDAEGGRHCIDIHWNLLSSWALSSLFDTDSVMNEAVDLSILGQGARMPALSTALLHACIHRAVHFRVAYFFGSEETYAGDRLIWFVDMDLLARRLSPEQWRAFVTQAATTGTAGLARDALLRCQMLLSTPIPDEILTELGTIRGGTLAERYLLQASLGKRIWANMRSLPKGRSRIAFLREIFLPPEKIMRKAYPERAGQALARLHLHRYRERIRRLGKERAQRRMSS